MLLGGLGPLVLGGVAVAALFFPLWEGNAGAAFPFPVLPLFLGVLHDEPPK